MVEEQNEIFCGLGVIGPDIPDSRDYNYKDHLAGAINGDNGVVDYDHLMPTSFNDYSLRNDIGDILNQGSTNSCTGHSAVYAMNVILRRIMSGQDMSNVKLTPYWPYYWARYDAGIEHRDGGAYMRSLMRALHEYGVYSIDMDSPGDKPGNYNLEDAFKLFEYFRIYGNNINEVKYALTVEKLPLFACIAVYDNIWNREGVVSMNFNRFQGYHAICLTGVKTINGKQHIEFVNSWGKSWGDNGFGYLPEEYIINTKLTPDIYCPTYKYN